MQVGAPRPGEGNGAVTVCRWGHPSQVRARRLSQYAGGGTQARVPPPGARGVLLAVTRQHPTTPAEVGGRIALIPSVLGPEARTQREFFTVSELPRICII